MIVWHHGLKRHEFEQAPGVSEGQGSSPWSRKELDMIEQLNNNKCECWFAMHTNTIYRQLQLSRNFYFSTNEINILEFKIKGRDKIFKFFQKVMTTLKK